MKVTLWYSSVQNLLTASHLIEWKVNLSQYLTLTYLPLLFHQLSDFIFSTLSLILQHTNLPDIPNTLLPQSIVSAVASITRKAMWLASLLPSCPSRWLLNRTSSQDLPENKTKQNKTIITTKYLTFKFSISLSDLFLPKY